MNLILLSILLKGQNGKKIPTFKRNNYRSASISLWGCLHFKQWKTFLWHSNNISGCSTCYWMTLILDSSLSFFFPTLYFCLSLKVYISGLMAKNQSLEINRNLDTEFKGNRLWPWDFQDRNISSFKVISAKEVVQVFWCACGWTARQQTLNLNTLDLNAWALLP